MRFLLVLFATLTWCDGAVLRSNQFRATITVTEEKLGKINRNIYGQYLEHVQPDDECIYPSIWDNSASNRMEHGLRRDVMLAAREMGTPVVRWPGGCFADVYHWRDGVGPQSSRPMRTNEHWGGLEPNHFGTDEFLQWSKRVGSEAYINANLGTGTLQECLDWLRYCNAVGRRVTYWGIGNETFADWEAGHMDAPTYARTLKEWAGAVRKQDPAIKIMGVGSMSADNPAWDRAVLESAGDLIDYLTIHAYAYSTGHSNEFLSVAFTPSYFEQRLQKMLKVVDEFASKRGDSEPIRLSLDEWNIRHYQNGKLNRKDPRNLQDAIFVSGVLNSMIRLSPRVGMANYVFLVNGNAVMLVKGNQVIRTPLFHIFQQYSQWMTGDALGTKLDCPTTLPPLPQVHSPKHKPPADFVHTNQPWLDAVAAQKDGRSVTVSIVNRHLTQSADTELNLPKGFRPTKTWTLAAPSVLAANTFEFPEQLVPEIKQHRSRKIACPPHSVTLILCEQK